MPAPMKRPAVSTEPRVESGIESGIDSGIESTVQSRAEAQVGSRPQPLRVIRAGVGDTVRLIRLADVVYLQATDKYVNVVTADSEVLIREPLRDLLPRLDAQQFVQVHRSTVVNLDFVRSASRDEAGKLWLTLEGRTERVGVSRLYAHLFRAM